MAEEMNLYQKLAKIRAISDVAQKSRKGYGYSYTDITEILANVTAGMKKYGVSLIPSIVPGTASVQQNVVVNTKVDKTGRSYENKATEMLVCAEMVFRWVNNDNPNEVIDVPWIITGAQGDPSQAFGSGISYCTRYFLCSYFQIAQTDSDVDEYRSKQKEAEVAESKAIAEEIIKALDIEIKQFLADNPDKTDDVKKLITRFVKNGNYFAIKEPNLAGKLLEDFRNIFTSSGEQVY